MDHTSQKLNELAEFNLVASALNCQTAKLNSRPNFLTYLELHPRAIQDKSCETLV